MKRITQCGLMPIGSIAIVLASITFARSDDSPESVLRVIDVSQDQTLLGVSPVEKPDAKRKVDAGEVAADVWQVQFSGPGPEAKSKVDAGEVAADVWVAQAPGKAPPAQEQGNKTEPAAPPPDTARPTPSTESASTPDYGSDTNRGESASNVATTSSPNMIGDLGGNKTLRSTIPLPSRPGPLQFGSFNVPPAVIAQTPPLSGNLPTTATTVFGSPVPGTTFTINNLAAPALPTAIPLTNNDAAYTAAANQALTNFYQAQNTANQQLSKANITGDLAAETDPHAGPISSTDTFSVTQFYQYQYSIIPGYITINIPSPSGGVIGRQRLADDENPLPTDRVFCDYSYFHDAALASPSDANRLVPGFEKTFFNGNMSVEMRFPMGVMESNSLVADNPTFGTTGQFGDMQVIFKAIVDQEETWALSVGLDVSVPTGPDVNVGLADGTPLVKIANRSTHLLPFLGLLVTPNEDWFAQAYLQFDVGANGDPVYANVNGTGLTPNGEIYDQTQIFVDTLIGRWLYRNPSRRYSGFAAVLETHYTGGLNAPSALQAGNYAIGGGTAALQCPGSYHRRPCGR